VLLLEVERLGGWPEALVSHFIDHNEQCYDQCVFVMMTSFVLAVCTWDSLASDRTLIYLLRSMGENLEAQLESLGYWATLTRRNATHEALQLPMS